LRCSGVSRWHTLASARRTTGDVVFFACATIAARSGSLDFTASATANRNRPKLSAGILGARALTISVALAASTCGYTATPIETRMPVKARQPFLVEGMF
jgi:hypothetical protein